MVERLRMIDSDVDAVTWDAYRSDTGAWVVSGAWRAGEKSGTARWTFDLPSRTVAPLDAATTDFAEGTRLVRVVPDVPTGPVPVPAPSPAQRARPVTVLPAAEPPVADDAPVRDVHPASGSPEEDRTVDTLLDEIADHDTVVLGRPGEDRDSDDPRARIPAWEDIVFGVRRTR
jgi:hypothetical protein